MVETGTYRGDTVAACLGTFERIISIELDPAWAALARRRFSHEPRVELLHGDSAELLPGVVRALKGPALFWLDGHWSGPGSETARGSAVTPILEELRVVLSSRPDHVVLIDDARLFGSSPGYPSLDEIRQVVEDVTPAGSRIFVLHDIIYVASAPRGRHGPASTGSPRR